MVKWRAEIISMEKRSINDVFTMQLGTTVHTCHSKSHLKQTFQKESPRPSNFTGRCYQLYTIQTLLKIENYCTRQNNCLFWMFMLWFLEALNLLPCMGRGSLQVSLRRGECPVLPKWTNNKGSLNWKESGEQEAERPGWLASIHSKMEDWVRGRRTEPAFGSWRRWGMNSQSPQKNLHSANTIISLSKNHGTPRTLR